MAVMRYKDGLLPNTLAMTYILLAYGFGWLLLFSSHYALNGIGLLLLAHSMVIAAYLLHECAHNTIFKSPQHNALLGEILAWINGACYGSFDNIRDKHFRHHVDRADVVAFDYRSRLARFPRALKIIQALEWAYIPAVEILMHALVLVLPFTLASRRQRRTRILLVLAMRGTLLLYLAVFHSKVFILYITSYLLFITVMRFMDVHQHTYEIFETLEQPRGAEAKQFDRDYEHANTYSNLISTRHPWLNLLVLNFGYHNAHHFKSAIPWHRLPALHEQQYGDDDDQLLDFASLLKSYHRYRVPRILNDDDDIRGLDRGRGFIGVDGVSFLTAH
jgi:fatty acid desaturase